MNFQLALVTGASSGLGFALCQLLSKKGIPLIVAGRDEKRLALAASLPHVTESVLADLSQNREHLLQTIREKTPDLVINNAGYGFYGPALAQETAIQMDLLDVNANAPIEIALEAARVLQSRKKSGVILNVSSTAGEIPVPAMALYSAAKASLTSFSQSFDREMRPYGIRVLAAVPGPIATPFAKRASNNRYGETNRFAMQPEFVAEKIWKQIQSGKSKQIIDWRVHLGLFFLKALPRWAADRILLRNLNRRCNFP